MDLKLAPILQRLDRLEEKVDDLQTDMVYVRKHVCNLDHMVKSEVVPRLKTITADHSRRLQRLESIG